VLSLRFTNLNNAPTNYLPWYGINARPCYVGTHKFSAYASKYMYSNTCLSKLSGQRGFSGLLGMQYVATWHACD